MPGVTVSKHYRHTVSELYKDYLEHRITEQELSQYLDEASEEEAKKLEHLGPSLIRQALENVEKDLSEEQKKAFEAKAQQEQLAQRQRKQKEWEVQRENERKARDERRAKERKEIEEQKALDAEQGAKEQERLSFRKVTETNIAERNKAAMRLQWQYNIWQIILLVFSALTATLAGIDGVARGWVAFTGVVATIAGGMLTTFKIQDRIYANHKAVAELRLECQKYNYHIEEYKGSSAEEAFIKFSRAINIILGEQMLQEVELWNPKGDKNQKSLPNAKEDEQEKKDSEPSEEHGSEDLLTEHGESDEGQREVVPDHLREDVPLRGMETS